MFSEAIYIPVVSVCPVREAPNHRSEMTSQLLLGEQVHVLDNAVDGWLQIRSLHDGYEGWCQAIQLAELVNPTEPIGYYDHELGFANVNGQPMPVFMGTPVHKETIQAGVFSISFTGLTTNTTDEDKQVQVAEIALQYLNTPYLWGGRTFAGIDCSGFVQMVYRQLGIHMQRDAWMQAAEGESVGFLQEAQPGDLAFFDEPDGRITHVGILLNDHEIIHSSGKVRIDDIDHQGIISRDQKKRTHKLRIIKRYFS
ncbi:C40 family peptidase [Flavihumibacter cheonanensis]|uniref:C40 family peptidase n=1 Tax=Flavihumibacter cheonanensis TaxID=1442385 RepID=UPI001EF7C35B|nr:C40 family peptidase [Flavihumibacter cheonanensis]MCG7751812.1 C40 family peptidase [Flavihumibacter cheonanensis]